jgi:hypothetical protein
MWANHDWLEIQPYKSGTPQKPLFPGRVTPATFARIGDHLLRNYFKYWDQAATRFGVPYFPNVTMGWDSSPRAAQEDEFGDFGYPFTNTIGQNSPENFRTALEMTRQRLLADPGGLRILNINCWNEWTEGSYLEPDTVHGYKYLEAVRSVFGVK